jgi:hypothetical protein
MGVTMLAESLLYSTPYKENYTQWNYLNAQFVSVLIIVLPVDQWQATT